MKNKIMIGGIFLFTFAIGWMSSMIVSRRMFCDYLANPTPLTDNIVLEMNYQGLSMSQAEILWRKIEGIRSAQAHQDCVGK